MTKSNQDLSCLLKALKAIFIETHVPFWDV